MIHHPYLISFIERSIKEAQEFQQLLKLTDKTEYLRREIEITEAQVFLASTIDNDHEEDN